MSHAFPSQVSHPGFYLVNTSFGRPWSPIWFLCGPYRKTHYSTSSVQTLSGGWLALFTNIRPIAIPDHDFNGKNPCEKVLMALEEFKTLDIKVASFPLVTCCEAKYGQPSTGQGGAGSGLLQIICTPQSSLAPSCRSLAHTQQPGPEFTNLEHAGTETGTRATSRQHGTEGRNWAWATGNSGEEFWRSRASLQSPLAPCTAL